MPRPNGKKPNSWKNQFNDDTHNHDEYRNFNNTRRVSFKQNNRQHQGNPKTERQKDWGSKLREHFIQEDIDMGATSTDMVKRRAFRNYNNNQRKGGSGGGGGGGQHGQNDRRKLLEGATGWYRVTIPYGSKYDKEFLVKLIMEKVAPTPFQPIMWSTSGKFCSFYIDDFKLAMKINNLDREVSLPDGYKLLVRVFAGFPNVDVNDQLRDKIKQAMVKRYNAEHRALDLTRFHMDVDLQDVFCALFKPVIMVAVLDVIAENIPTLEALKLDDNKLHMFPHMVKFATKLPQLKILHLKDNKLKDFTYLQSLNGMPLVELVLEGNPLCAKIKDQTTYVSEVRKLFPKVLKLDGTELPPPISFDIEEETTLPAAQQTYLCNTAGQDVVRQFLEQYYLIMDSDSRQPLLQAYHETAMFSVTMAYPYGQNPKNSPYLTWYQTDNRNLQRITDPDRRFKLLKQGHLQIVSYLNDMPSTKHDIHSFTVDLTLFTPQMMVLTVTGLFKELNSGHKTPPIRSFHRTMVIIPAGSGFCIANEELHVTNGTDLQIKSAFKGPKLAPPVTAVTSPTAASPASTSLPIAPALDDNAKQAMVIAFAKESSMNLEWSQRCLEETSWDFQKAALAFNEARNRGVIPTEAYVK